MGNGFTVKEADTTLTSLNHMLNDDVTKTRDKFMHLKAVFPDFLKYTDDTSDRRKWRLRTLRFAGLLLTADIDFRSSAHPFPGRNFKRWLRWLTWLQVMPDPATVMINGAPEAVHPAEAVMETIRLTLEDPNGRCRCEWGERAAMVVEVGRRSPNYAITIWSKKEQDVGGPHDNDEDDL
jgi:hypothetical protein